TAHWRASGVIESQRAALAPLTPVKQILVMSGSASPMTAQQIQWASQNGFDAIRLPAEEFIKPRGAEKARGALQERALKSLASGKSVVIYTAAGPDDPDIRATRERLAANAGGSSNTARVLGTEMGRMMRDLLAQSGLRRAVIAGGDTSSYATQELGLYGLEMRAELTPGAPLCRGYSNDPRFDQLEIALKGGQMGRLNYFGQVRGS
ncbi:MAG: nucleotide-binding domain containing protein, partial [Betaproteobacteria bacterium]